MSFELQCLTIMDRAIRACDLPERYHWRSPEAMLIVSHLLPPCFDVQDMLEGLVQGNFPPGTSCVENTTNADAKAIFEKEMVRLARLLIMP